MDPDTQALMTVVRSQLKSVRRQVSTLARLLAELEHRLAPENDGQPQEAHRHGNNEDE